MSKGKALIVICSLLAITGIACLIAGVVFITKSKPSCAEQGSREERCAYSPEASRHHLPEFFQKVQDVYYELHPENIARKPKVTSKEIFEKFMPYDPSPARLQYTTDRSLELYQELKSKKIVKHKMKPRERKGLAQLLHYLKTIFGTQYDGNYYTGDYLLGPNMFCWQRICKSYQYALSNIGLSLKPSSVKEFESVLKRLKALNHTFTQYKENLKYGVKAGMVRSVEPCKVGVDSLIGNLMKDVAKQTPQGIAEHSIYMLGLNSTFFSKLSSEAQKQWLDKTRKSVTETMEDHIRKYVATPLYEMINYLKTTYKSHCVPSEVSSGLSQLPISHVYTNQTKTNITTHPYLPDGTLLNGSRAYMDHVLPYFTTTDLSPDEVHQIGQEMIEKLYSQILELARNFTNTSDTDAAKELFYKQLNDSSMYYAESEDIPEIESNGTAYENCQTTSEAKKNCPVRWNIMQKWFEDVNRVMSSLDYNTVDMFHFVGPKHTTPNCPVKPTPNFQPNMGVPSYRPSSRNCYHPSFYLVPFFLNRPGPKFTQLSVNSHEARPGHHTQVQGNLEHFYDSCGGVIGWLGSNTRYTVFAEGWGLYAENPLIAADTDVYNDKPLDKYGMLRGQIWRALRLVVDTGLHFKNFSRQEALKYFKDYIWDDSDVVEKEITRYQSNYGQATSYMIGQLHLIKLRARAQKELGAKFNMKDFHYYLLKDGSAPLDYLTEIIDDYIRCTKDDKGDGCKDILDVSASEDEKSQENAINIDNEFLDEHIVESYY